MDDQPSVQRVPRSHRQTRATSNGRPASRQSRSSAVARTTDRAASPGHSHAGPPGPTVEVKPGLTLPPPQNLLLPGPLGIIKDDGRTRGELVTQDGQRGIAR